MRTPSRPRTPYALAVTVTALALAGCSGGEGAVAPSTSGGAPAWTPETAPASPAPSSPVGGPDTGTGAGPRPAPSTAPPLGRDLACMNPDRCYLQNPAKRTDAELVRYFRSVEGADRPPAPAMRPWAYVVLGAGERRLVARSAPSADAPEVTDDIGILNHRAVFAFCRQDGAGRPVRPGAAPQDVWFRIEPLTASAPAQVWMNGRYLVPYGHDGAIPSC